MNILSIWNEIGCKWLEFKIPKISYDELLLNVDKQFYSQSHPNTTKEES